MLRVCTWLVPKNQLPRSLVLLQLFPCCGTIHARLDDQHIDPALADGLTKLVEQVGRGYRALEKPADRPALTVRFYPVNRVRGGELATVEISHNIARFEVAADLITPELAAALGAHSTQLCYQLASAYT